MMGLLELFEFAIAPLSFRLHSSHRVSRLNLLLLSLLRD
jgi:hypothetical protein